AARRPAPAQRRPRLRPVRPCRLERPQRGHPGDRRLPRAGHPRQRRADGSLAARAGSRCRCRRNPLQPRGRRLMQAFARLFAELDATTSSNAKRAAMVAYFRSAPPEDAAWAVYFLAGGKPRQLVPTRVLRDFALGVSGLPEWLFDECYHAVGDLAETIAHLTGPPGSDTVAAAPGVTRPEQPGLAR